MDIAKRRWPTLDCQQVSHSSGDLLRRLLAIGESGVCPETVRFAAGASASLPLGRGPWLRAHFGNDPVDFSDTAFRCKRYFIGAINEKAELNHEQSDLGIGRDEEKRSATL